MASVSAVVSHTNKKLTARKEVMRARLSFLLEVFKHLDTLLIGYETTVEVPDGEKIIHRRLWVGKSEETELYLENGEIVKMQNGKTRLLQDQLAEDEP